MTGGFFCDLHPDEQTSSQREDKPKYEIRIAKKEQVFNKKTGKKELWTQDMNPIASCHKDIMSQVIERAKALGVEISWGQRYQLRNINGKFTRLIHPDDMSEDEKKEAEQNEAENAGK